jgi:glycosyltransferase involved in cell wall biosynthesis
MGLRIALISEHASPLAAIGGVDAGGQNVYVGQVARHLAALGHEVDVFTRRDRADLPETVEWAPGVRVVPVEAGPAAFVRKEDMLPLMPAFARSMLDRMRREESPYDLCHANFFMSGLVAADIKKRTRLPFVVTFHALGRVRRSHQREADAFPPERMAIEERVSAEADRVIAECPQDRDDLIRHYGADPAKIAVVPCGFDPAEFWPVPKPEARAALGFAADESLILHLGRLVPRKGIDTVIRAFSRLRRVHGRKARLVIVGGDAEDPRLCSSPEMSRLAGLARRERVAGDVLFTGSRPREALRLYYSAADMFVTTPWYEPFGITPLEAMACGTPVIGSRVGGIQYSVVDGGTGFLVPPKDPGALAERMACLYRFPGLIAAMSRRAVLRVNAFFRWSGVAGAVAELYRDVLFTARVRPASLSLGLFRTFEPQGDPVFDRAAT